MTSFFCCSFVSSTSILATLVLLPFDIGRVWDTAQRLLRLFQFGLSFPFEYFSLQLLPHGGFLLFP